MKEVFLNHAKSKNISLSSFIIDVLLEGYSYIPDVTQEELQEIKEFKELKNRIAKRKMEQLYKTEKVSMYTLHLRYKGDVVKCCWGKTDQERKKIFEDISDSYYKIALNYRNDFGLKEVIKLRDGGMENFNKNYKLIMEGYKDVRK